ncbi:MAG: septum site-determining protein MinC [Roseburia sp.]|nr:septum site-determining protein MinC [Roseburia sp.]
MAQTVMIKSNKYGINLILDPNIAFVDLLKAVIEKFKESEKFFKNSKLGISFEGRRLSGEEEQKIIDAITENTSIEILCVVDNSEESAEKMKAQIDAYSEAIEREYAKAMSSSGEFYRGTLRSGQVLESDASITILGDVNPGARVTSGGNIVVLGALKGNAQAGIYGDTSCFILALEMEPIQIQIGNLLAKSPDKEKKKRRIAIREKKDSNELQIAVARDGNIYIEPVSKKILNNM